MVKKRTVLFTVAFILLCATIVTVFASFYSNSQDGEAIADMTNKENMFSDVKESDWFYSDVEYANENGLMKGTGENTFSPNATTTRGMIVTVLWRLEGELIEEDKSFADVQKDAYYHDAVAWAANNQIVTGYNDTNFGPEDNATREQFATIIYRYASYKKCDLTKMATLDEYIDKSQISDYAITAIQWANANGIITGTSNNTLSPEDYVQRSQLAAILKRFCTQFAILTTNDSTDDASKTEKDSGSSASNNTGASNNNGSSSGGSSGNSSEPAEYNTKNTYPSLIVNGTSAKPGDDVQVTITLENNPGILGMALTAYYDEAACLLKSVENGDAFKGILDLTTSQTLNSGVRFIWDSVDISQDDIKDGSTMVMNFSIPGNTKEGKYPITLKYSDGDIVDKNLADVAPIIENGYITVITK